MTTIAYRDGILAADSGATYSSEAGGSRKASCHKLYRKIVEFIDVPASTCYDPAANGGEGATFAAPQQTHKEDILIGTAGESAPALLYLDILLSVSRTHERWQELRAMFADSADFSVLILSSQGLYEADKWMREEKVLEPYWAIGSGSKVALGAMEIGASAVEAVVVAKRWDPYTFGPVLSARLWFGSPDPDDVKLLDAAAPGTVIEIGA